MIRKGLRYVFLEADFLREIESFFPLRRTELYRSTVSLREDSVIEHPDGRADEDMVNPAG